MQVSYSLLMVANKALKKMGRETEIAWSDARVREVRPATTTHYAPAVFLDGQIEKIRGSAFGALQPQIDKMFGIEQHQDPILAITLRDVFVADKILLSGLSSKTFNIKLPDRMTWPEPFEQVTEPAALSTSFLGTNFFGHWLRDDCATDLLAADVAPTWWLDTPPWPDKAAYQAAFGQTLRRANGRVFRELTLFHDIGQNRFKADRFRTLRAHLRAATPPQDAAPDLVYIKRGKSGVARTLVNEAEVVALMERMGALIVEPETGAEEMIAACLDARIVISVEGSQFSHALYALRDGGGLVAIQPPERFYGSHRDWSAELDMTFGFVVADPAEGGFRVDVDALAQTVDMVSGRVDAAGAA